MFFSLHKWLKIAFLNLLIVSLLGIILRYKIAFSLPFIEQKNLLHGHSHFAFAGWITQALMFLLIKQLQFASPEVIIKKYKWILYSNLITAYGMLLSFPFEGYGLFSIIFSTLSVFVSYWFAIVFWKDLNKEPEKKVAHYYFKAAIFFNAISSIGAFALAFMMVKKIIAQKISLLAVYFFLHFQYNGWFLFGCLGLLTIVAEKFIVNKKLLFQIFLLFFIASVPAYFLSALWLPIPLLLYLLVVISAIIQAIAWFLFLQLLIKNKIQFANFNTVSKLLFTLSAVALSIKIILQALSTIPSLSQLAFGFRPIVIGYLHLVLLGFTSIFLFSYILQFEINFLPKKIKTGIYVFVIGIILNEVLLMLQGTADLFYFYIPFLNEALFAVAIILFAGLLKINLPIVFGKNNFNKR